MKTVITNKLKTKKKKISSRKFPFQIKNQRVGIAVSGGVDSMVLLDVFCRLREKNNLELYALHYNHKWRKKSYLDAKLVKNYCKKNEIEFLYSQTKGKVTKDEEIARNQRYLFFSNIAKKYKLNSICTAHHKDDQIETILFRLARGTGPKGLMPIKQNLTLLGKVKIVRPFLNITKREIYTYADKCNVPFNEDITNNDLTYKRNLIRKKIIPLFQKINKEALNNILLCCELIYAQDQTLNNYFLSLLKSLTVRNPLIWNRNRFLKLDQYTQKALLYWFLSSRDIKGNLIKIDFILECINNQKVIDINNNFRLIVDKSNISFERKDKNTNVKKYSSGSKQSLILKPYKRKAFYKRFPQDKKKIAYVDLSKFKGNKLTVRYREPHDVFFPLGFSKPIKLKNYLINKKIPKEERYDLPLLCSGNEVLWIPGYSLSDKLKVLNKPTHILELRE